jgi:hypothetical protein
MLWQVDGKTGEQVRPNDKGKYPRGSIPYPDFAISNAEVKAIYDRLGQSGASLDQL